MTSPTDPISNGSSSKASDSAESSSSRTSQDPTLNDGDIGEGAIQQHDSQGSNSTSNNMPAQLRQTPKATAAQSQLSNEEAAGTIGSWSQRPEAAPTTAVAKSEDEAFWEAAQKGDLKKVRYFAEEKGIFIDKTDERGNSVLHLAVLGGSMDVIRYLVEERKANVNAISKEFDATPLFWAISHRKLDIVIYLINHGASAAHRDSIGNSVLHAAVHSDMLSTLAFLLSTQYAALGYSVDPVDTYGMTPLMWAAYQCKQDMVELLLHLGASINMQDKTGKSPLHFAMMNGIPSIKVKLLAKGADPNLKDFGSGNNGGGGDGSTNAQAPCDIAASHGYRDAFEDHIKEAATLRDQTDPGYTILGRSLRKEICAVLLPLAGVGLSLYVISLYPWFVGIPLGLGVLAGMQYIFFRYITKKQMPFLLQRLPYMTTIFQSSALYILITWVTRVLPVTTRGYIDDHPIPTHKLLNLVFMLLFGVCMYYFYKTLLVDPGIIPRNTNIQAAAPAIRKLAEESHLDSEHFCFTCLNLRPLRSKHCRFSGHCVARFDHYCPWTCNSIGVNNHRQFVAFLITLTCGIITYVLLVRHYLASVYVVYDPIPGQPCYLGDYACGLFQSDSWTVVSTGWISLNCLWVIVLLVSQLYQISIGQTTNEFQTGFMRLAPRKSKSCKHEHAHGKHKSMVERAASRLRTLIIGIGGTVAVEEQTAPAAAISQPESDSRPPPISHSNTATSDELLPQNADSNQLSFALRNIGYTRLRDEDVEKAKSNPFSFGMINNCLEFWTLGAEGKLVGVNWFEVMEAVELAPYKPPQPPNETEDESEAAHTSLYVAV
ncbi:palmitoyltransferase akr1 [Coemansia guatemalensis]|uniref:Palmitoyltransferase n=1 Tax=Coemansia guatemalensis TaxID=2761395 RepID=A0A9W8LVE7_9FUNG|nr:palmitoyltransferase akr1 [Coemansia guatemalensis]